MSAVPNMHQDREESCAVSVATTRHTHTSPVATHGNGATINETTKKRHSDESYKSNARSSASGGPNEKEKADNSNSTWKSPVAIGVRQTGKPHSRIAESPKSRQRERERDRDREGGAERERERHRHRPLKERSSRNAASASTCKLKHESETATATAASDRGAHSTDCFVADPMDNNKPRSAEANRHSFSRQTQAPTRSAAMNVNLTSASPACFTATSTSTSTSCSYSSSSMDSRNRVASHDYVPMQPPAISHLAFAAITPAPVSAAPLSKAAPDGPRAPNYLVNPLLLDPNHTPHRRAQPQSQSQSQSAAEDRSTPELPDLAAFGETPHINANPVKNIITQLESMIASYDKFDSVYPVADAQPNSPECDFIMRDRRLVPRDRDRGRAPVRDHAPSHGHGASVASPGRPQTVVCQSRLTITPCTSNACSPAAERRGAAHSPNYDNLPAASNSNSNTSTLQRPRSGSPKKVAFNVADQSQSQSHSTIATCSGVDAHPTAPVKLDENDAAAACRSKIVSIKSEPTQNGATDFLHRDTTRTDAGSNQPARSTKLINMPQAPNSIITILRKARETGPQRSLVADTSSDQADSATHKHTHTLSHTTDHDHGRLHITAQHDRDSVGSSFGRSTTTTASSVDAPIQANAIAFSNAALEIERLLDEMRNVNLTASQRADEVRANGARDSNGSTQPYFAAVVPPASASASTLPPAPRRIDQFEPGKGCSLNEADELRYRNRLRIAQTQGTQTEVDRAAPNAPSASNASSEGKIVEREHIAAPASASSPLVSPAALRTKRGTTPRSASAYANSTTSFSASSSPQTSPAKRTSEPAGHDEYIRVAQGGEIPFTGLRRPFPERNELPYQQKVAARSSEPQPELSPVQRDSITARSREEKDAADAKRRVYVDRLLESERMKKHEQERLQQEARRHTDNYLYKEKSPVPLDRFDAGLSPESSFSVNHTSMNGPTPPSPPDRQTRTKIRGRARVLYAFRSQSAYELSVQPGELLYLVRRVDANWYECELANGMRGIVPANYLEII